MEDARNGDFAMKLSIRKWVDGTRLNVDLHFNA